MFFFFVFLFFGFFFLSLKRVPALLHMESVNSFQIKCCLCVVLYFLYYYYHGLFVLLFSRDKYALIPSLYFLLLPSLFTQWSGGGYRVGDSSKRNYAPRRSSGAEHWGGICSICITGNSGEGFGKTQREDRSQVGFFEASSKLVGDFK